jgi:thiamine-phosphate pyrophosphorylase
VATANFSRLQEAFRVLEEVSHDPSQVFSDLRFRTYSLEKKVVRLLARRKPEVLDGPCVCVIVTRDTLAGRDTLSDPLEFIRTVISGGAGMIQLREKSINDKEFLDYASAVHEIASDAGVLLVINDRADLAITVEADGVHVGQEDLSVKEARRVMGDNRIVGASTHSKEEIERACVAGADYIGFGPVYDTNTKEGVGPAVSPDALGAALSASSVPVYAIGGIGPENVCHVREAGARCVAVCGSAASASDPAAAIRDMLHDLRK